jgi:NAD(P)H-dependent FMN reductase
MAAKVVAIVGTYRKGGVTDSAVDAVLAGAKEAGADVAKIYLLDQHIEFCRNCRACTQQQAPVRGNCVIEDDMESILSQIDAADALVLGAPVNFFNVTAVFRIFMERLVSYSYWPWSAKAPAVRKPTKQKKAVLVTSAAMPTFLIRWATGAPRALKATANVLGAKSVKKIVIGFAAQKPEAELPKRVLLRARKLGQQLA